MRQLKYWNVKRVSEALQSKARFAPFPSAGAELESIKDNLGTRIIAELVAQARQDAISQNPTLSADLYLSYLRTGEREPYEDAQRLRRSMLYRLVLAEWLQSEGEFIDAIENIAWSRLEETNWAWPAHAPKGLDFPNHPTLDLAAAMTALDFAEIDYLLADRLSPQLRARLRSEVERRVIGPFLDRHDHWWLHSTDEKQVNNWTAVCVGGAVGAALYLEDDKDRLAQIIARGLASLSDYLDTFTGDGGSSEGPDYWSYGFGNFAVFAHLLACRTGGQIDLLDDAFVGSIAQFPVRTMLVPGIWASFSDSDSSPELHPGLLSLLARTLSLPQLKKLGVKNDFSITRYNQFIWPLRQFAWPLPEATAPLIPERHDWYPELGWMISRLAPEDPDALCMAIKGGHNDEMHNQNDIGSFIVVAGSTVLLTDPGRGRYSKAYFGPERYANLMTSSRGHSVPLVNGFEQAAGQSHCAHILNHGADAEKDWLELDMTAAYPDAAGLTSLVRKVTFKRQGRGAIELCDTFAFASRSVLTSALITSVDPQIGDGEITIGSGRAGIRISFDADQLALSLERHQGVEKQYAPAVDLVRILLAPTAPAKSGAIKLSINLLK